MTRESRTWKVAAAFLIVLASIVLAVSGNYALTLYSIRHSEQQWCLILDISVSTKPEHKLTAQQQRGFAALNQLRQKFGCEEQ